VRVMSLNVRKGGPLILSRVIDHIQDSAVDLCGFQEIRASTVGNWRTSLERAGYAVVDTFALAREHGVPHPSAMREDGLLIASRWPVRALKPNRIEIAWPERLLSVVVKHPAQAFEFHTTHVPNGSQGERLYYKEGPTAGRDRLEKKVDTLEAIFRALTRNKLMPRILAGDFNEPFSESPNGAIQYWQHKCPAGLRSTLQERWRDAADSVFRGLSAHGVQDAFRTKHGHGKAAHSWETNPKQDEDGLPITAPNLYRLDHLFASTEFTIETCDYDHSFRGKGLSDHAAIYAELGGRW
jgi:endonuclease/exonuclease/phosphatase family metal-dependent hydrolase